MGRIGLAAGPDRPRRRSTRVVETAAANKAGGTFRSTNRGETWEKRSDYVARRPDVLPARSVVDPKNTDRVYSMDVYPEGVGRRGQDVAQRSASAASTSTTTRSGSIPNDTDYYLVGCDGGLYESFDRGATWRFNANLPITQFYDVDVDDSKPFYYVYGGTQDNTTLGGPSRTLNAHGITNSRLVRHQRRRRLPLAVDP